MMMMDFSAHQLLEQVSNDLTTLPEEDLVLVATFVTYLKQQPVATPLRKTATALRIEAQRRAATLRDVPRSELVTRFQHIASEVHQQAIGQGTAIEGDWERD